ncbi:hypothetical protein [Endozoicomonas sp.]|uniref:hypothetical protein n=1 Tax=Endozoicomonas sp. TaxID=1892382 RepID=UPI0028858675|nr:hypothetical protein [Endozoicomonas sp.]
MSDPSELSQDTRSAIREPFVEKPCQASPVFKQPLPLLRQLSPAPEKMFSSNQNYSIYKRQSSAPEKMQHNTEGQHLTENTATIQNKRQWHSTEQHHRTSAMESEGYLVDPANQSPSSPQHHSLPSSFKLCGEGYEDIDSVRKKIKKE